MIRVLVLIFCWWLVHTSDHSQGHFDDLVEDFRKGYRALDLPPLNLSYVENLESVSEWGKLKNQELFFTEMDGRLGSIDQDLLSRVKRRRFGILRYEVALNLERIQLEARWLEERASLKKTRIYDETLGKEWYAYYLKRWVDLEVEPDSIFHFGLAEIKKV